jgi:hypothetical protein
VFLRFGHHDVPLPEPLAGHVVALTRHGRRYRGVGSPSASAWLFLATCPAARSPPPGSASACAHWASTPSPAAAPP